MSHSPRIAIVGGGLAGLTLGRILQLKKIPFTIFEREPSVNGRPQGGTLDLHIDGGQLALHKAELYDAFKTYMRKEGQAMKLADKTGKWLFTHDPDQEDESRPEIDRGQLRQIFLDILGDDIKWDSRIKSISKHAEGGYQLVFADSSSKTFDLVVGADGCFSLVTPMLSSDRPQYTGIAFLEMYLADADSKHPAEAATVGHGSMFSLGDYNGILAQRNSDGKIRVYAVLSVPEAWPKEHEKEYDWSNPSGDARAKLLGNFFKDWAPELRALVANSSGDSGIWPRPIYALPTGHRWSHTPGITAVGDAAHVMSPFAGAGANLAMLDGAKLGEAIAEGVANGGGRALEESIQKFEEWMFERAGLSAAESEQNLKACMQDKDGAQKMADKFTQLLKKP